MATTFKDVRKLQGERVRMRFDDGREVVAELLCATRDMDGTKHLIYAKVEAGQPEQVGATGCFYADAKTLVRIEHADIHRQKSGPSGKDALKLHTHFGWEMPRNWRPGA